MATLTLRTDKGSPLTHVELDANFTALDSDISAGRFDSGLTVDGGIILAPTGDVDISNGNLILRDGDIHYNPRLAFYDLIAASETMRIDSVGSFLIGSSVNSQNVNLKVTRTGNQEILFGNKTSNSGQTTFLKLGAAGDGTEGSPGIRSTQNSGNFDDYRMDIVAYEPTGDTYINAIEIDNQGNVTFPNEVTFQDSVQFDAGINMNGTINITGDIILNGGPLSSAGTVTSVGFSGPTGFATTGSPVTTSGTITLGYASSHSAGLPSNTLQGQWNQAFGWGDHAAEGYLTATDLSSYVQQTARSISTGNGLQGGGDLSANRTLSMTGSYTGDFDVTGNLRALQDVVAFYNTSDERAKTDISVIENALDKVSTLRGVEFEYRETGIRSTGLIAQEVKEVLPEAVFVTDDDTGMMGVRYQIMVGLLVEAIKELKAEVEELKK